MKNDHKMLDNMATKYWTKWLQNDGHPGHKMLDNMAKKCWKKLLQNV